MQVVDALYISRCTSLRFSLGHLRRSRIVVWARGKEAVDFCPPGTLDSWNVYQQVVRCKQPGRLQVLGWCDTKVIWHSPLYSAICLFSMDDWKNDYSWSINLTGHFWVRHFPGAQSGVFWGCSQLRLDWAWRSISPRQSLAWLASWWEGSVPLCVGLPARLLECPHNVAASFPRAQEKLDPFYDLASQIT